jgi:hypothetical protein
MKRVAIASTVLAGCLLFAPEAHAQEAVDIPGWSAQALVGFAFNDVGFGLGARGGYTLDNHVYIGGTLLYHLGNNGVSALMIGGEGGYDFPVGPIIIRPYGGLGMVNVSVSIPAYTVPGPGGPTTYGGGSVSDTKVGFWPGCQFLYSIPGNEKFFVGGDARILIIDNFNTLALYGVGGIHF